MNSVTSNNLSLKYQKFTLSGSTDIRIRKFWSVTISEFLYTLFNFTVVCNLSCMFFESRDQALISSSISRTSRDHQG